MKATPLDKWLALYADLKRKYEKGGGDPFAAGFLPCAFDYFSDYDEGNTSPQASIQVMITRPGVRKIVMDTFRKNGVAKDLEEPTTWKLLRKYQDGDDPDLFDPAADHGMVAIMYRIDADFKLVSETSSTPEKVMVLTQSYAKQRFDHWNATLFGGKLPDVPIEIKRMKGASGRTTTNIIRNGPLVPGWITRGRLANNEQVTGYKIDFDNMFKLTPEQIDGVILHEMIHLWMSAVAGRPREGHGPEFMAKLAQLSRMVSFKIPLTHDAGELEMNEEINARRVFVILAGKPDGKHSIAIFSPDAAARDDYALIRKLNLAYWAKRGTKLSFHDIKTTLAHRFPVQRSAANVKFYFISDGEAEHIRRDGRPVFIAVAESCVRSTDNQMQFSKREKTMATKMMNERMDARFSAPDGYSTYKFMTAAKAVEFANTWRNRGGDAIIEERPEDNEMGARILYVVYAGPLQTFLGESVEGYPTRLPERFQTYWDRADVGRRKTWLEKTDPRGWDKRIRFGYCVAIHEARGVAAVAHDLSSLGRAMARLDAAHAKTACLDIMPEASMTRAPKDIAWMSVMCETMDRNEFEEIVETCCDKAEMKYGACPELTLAQKPPKNRRDIPEPQPGLASYVPPGANFADFYADSENG